MNPPKISVVIPLYNKSGYIGRALQSVLSQTVQPVEIVVVDDGSTDAGPVEVKAMMQDHQLIRLYTQENQGVSVARNKGVAIASGNHIAFLDADDSWLPVHLETLLKLITEFPNAVIYGTAYRRLQRNGRQVSLELADAKGGQLLISDYFKIICQAQFIYTSSIMMPKELIEKSGGFPVGVRNGEDRVLWARAAATGDIAYSAAVTVNYDCNVAGQATGRSAVHRGFQSAYVKCLAELAHSDIKNSQKKKDISCALVSGVEQVMRKYMLLGTKGQKKMSEFMKAAEVTLDELPLRLRILMKIPWYPYVKMIWLPMKWRNSIRWLELCRGCRVSGGMKYKLENAQADNDEI